jgi:hypothetical protein
MVSIANRARDVRRVARMCRLAPDAGPAAPGRGARVAASDFEEDATMLHQRMLAFAAAAAIALAGSAATLAQDATPGPGGMFDDLGLPELTITVTDEGYSLDQSEVEAGRYLVTLDNQTENPDVYPWIVQLPEGRTVDDITYADEVAGGTPPPSMETGPTEEMLADLAWLFETYIAGAPSTAAEVARQVVVNLPAGEYAIGDEDPFSQMPAAALTVTGDPAAEITGPEPEAAVTILEEGVGGQGFSFVVDGTLTAGPQIVKVVNNSDQPHFVDASQYPEPVTIEQVMASFMFDPSGGATPSPDMIDFERVEFVGWAGTQSQGTTQWIVMDPAPGQVLLLCFIPDPLAGGIPHAFEGMAQLFEVAEA